MWEKSHRLFSKFDEIARKNNWVKPQLADLMKHIRRYEFLYWDLRRPRPDDPPGPLQPPREFTEEEKEEVWRVAAEHFPNSMYKERERERERDIFPPSPSSTFSNDSLLQCIIRIFGPCLSTPFAHIWRIWSAV